MKKLHVSLNIEEKILKDLSHLAIDVNMSRKALLEYFIVKIWKDEDLKKKFINEIQDGK